MSLLSLAVSIFLALGGISLIFACFAKDSPSTTLFFRIAVICWMILIIILLVYVASTISIMQINLDFVKKILTDQLS